MSLYLGVDVGSISANFVLMNSDKKILDTFYTRILGEPCKSVQNIIKKYHCNLISQGVSIKGICFTGTGGKFFKDLFQNEYENEIITHVLAVEHLLQIDVGTIIEIGGQDSKLIFTRRINNNTLQLENFSMNAMCAAGTGAFLDHQADRLNIKIEQLGEYALKSTTPARIAGRCSVFAKSDMIHLQQESAPLEDILYGLCHALARNYIATLGKGKVFKKPIVFQGGVAANQGMVRAFESLLKLSKNELIIPLYFNCMGAIGAALTAINKKNIINIEAFLNKLEELKSPTIKGLPILKNSVHKIYCESQQIKNNDDISFPYYIGIDVGSVSINLVVLDNNNRLIIKKYIATAGKPIENIKKVLSTIKIDDSKIAGVGITGSGRYLIGNFVGADVFKDEITAQARAVQNSNIDTIFEIGGQDSKYIQLNNGVVSAFEMNKVCAAGTGSFLEEQANRLGIKIEEFGDLALSAKNPVQLGERCAVFTESDLVHYQQLGVNKEDLVAGLCYAIVKNYLNTVVQGYKLGDSIAFQGGVAFNKGVIAAFEKILGKRIYVPEHHEVSGAIGAALIVKESNIIKTKFKGFNLPEKYKLQSFECGQCANHCEIKQLVIDKEKSYYGSRCGKYDDKKLIINKTNSLYNQYLKILNNHIKITQFPEKVGIPFCLGLYESIPFWNTFFNKLKFQVILSEPNKAVVEEGLKISSCDLCYPVKIMYSNVLDLVFKKVDFIFLPYMLAELSAIWDCMCPYIQAAPDMVKAAMRNYPMNLLSPNINKKLIFGELLKLAKPLKRTKKDITSAYKEANYVQNAFQTKINEITEHQLKILQKQKTIVLLGRPYNIFDSRINIGIPQILEKLFEHVIPMTLFPKVPENSNFYTSNIYWFYGKKIAQIMDFIKDKPNIYPVYLTNFGCIQDSMLTQISNKLLDNKPCLILEVDEHSSATGIITRCEAFANTLKCGSFKE